MLHIKKIKIKEDNDMKIINKDIDSGKPFDWGQTSLDYAKFRDIYPQEFYQRIVDRKLCLDGQTVLDKYQMLFFPVLQYIRQLLPNPVYALALDCGIQYGKILNVYRGVLPISSPYVP